MFASRTLTEHVLRGVGGFSLFGLALWFMPTFWPAILLVPFGLLFLRGCPMCWTIGLVETSWNAIRRLRGQQAVEICASCAYPQESGNRRGT